MKISYAWHTKEILVGWPVGKLHLRDIGLDGRIILKQILKNSGVRMWTRFICLRIRSIGELL
jgi:hypothetical protein